MPRDIRRLGCEDAVCLGSAAVPLHSNVLLAHRDPERGANKNHAPFLSHFISVVLKMIILPRQARDKHREKVEHKGVLFCV